MKTKKTKKAKKPKTPTEFIGAQPGAKLPTVRPPKKLKRRK